MKIKLIHGIYLAFYHFKYQFKTVVPSQNLMKNIGFDAQATHTVLPNLELDNLKLGHLKPPYKERFDVVMTKQIDDCNRGFFARKSVFMRIIRKIYGFLR